MIESVLKKRYFISSEKFEVLMRNNLHHRSIIVFINLLSEGMPTLWFDSSNTRSDRLFCCCV